MQNGCVFQLVLGASRTFKCMLITAVQLLAAQSSLNMLCSPRRRRLIVLDESSRLCANTIKRALRHFQPLLVQRKLVIDNMPLGQDKKSTMAKDVDGKIKTWSSRRSA
ncbi:hypothetical protein P3T76_008571 [Phytophthora citrophthora]|uniref:Uncharacterized protein n=1 Tax=Phytophthora citrophthora TaxID=4793 RepID=A0AAD9LKL8_9STRA|nr:hypothetical protein P3T76_008571 [Phytophthora citrophthora]